ncbi:MULTISPECIES: MFS transporter [unclassified Pseudonocardia]|uniref:MFS transporter n=1 Tax=unclassified Pseudonocardia TaxID=2619320 RepID=UPI0001FFDA95|nr:MFS transporter [Pseudonocardia sp. Ae707_Ps1]OLM20279.1 L-Proline/Glycine betaine transporter ProP [Pseudonocardia sp. Ae707_Ps1]
MSEATPEEATRIGRKASTAAAVGTAIEYYDFAIYGYLAVVLAPLFFPSQDGLIGVLATLVVVAGGFVARPIGGLIFGRLGDRRGRRAVLMATVALMGVSTVLTGLLPTYATIGVAAPILLAVLRIAQGISAGGEIGGAASLATESAPAGRRGLFGSATSIGVTLGLAGAAAAVGTVTALTTPEQLASWGWRIPFLIAGPLLVGAVLYRMRVEDSPVFQELVQHSEPEKAPVTEVLRNHRTSVLRTVGIVYATLTTGSLASVYILVHLSAVLEYSLTGSLWLVVLIVLLPIGLVPWAGALSDRFGRRAVLAAAQCGFLVLAVPCFWVMQQGSLVLAMVAAVVLNIPFAVQQGVLYTLLPELFPTRIRYTGVSIGFNIGGVLGSGLVSVIATGLVSLTGNTLAPSFYMIFAAAVGLLVVVITRETVRDVMGTEAPGAAAPAGGAPR